MPRKPLIITFLILTLAVVLGVVFGIPYMREIRNKQLMEKELQAGAIVIEETTVGKVNGIRVGTGNLGKEYFDAEGIKRQGLNIQLLVLSGEKSGPIIAYPGRVITIGDKSYRVNRIWATKGKGGWISLLPVGGQGVIGTIGAATEDIEVKERLFREQEIKAGAIIIAAGQKGQQIGTTPVFAAPLEIAQQNNAFGNNPVYGLRTSISIQLPDGIWQTIGQEPDNPRTPAHTIGDIVEIGGNKYRVNFLWRIEGQNGWVSLLSVSGPEPDLSIFAPLETHVRKRNETEIFLGTRDNWKKVTIEMRRYPASGYDFSKERVIEHGIDSELVVSGTGILHYREHEVGESLPPLPFRFTRYIPFNEFTALVEQLIAQDFVAMESPEYEWLDGRPPYTVITLINSTLERHEKMVEERLFQLEELLLQLTNPR